MLVIRLSRFGRKNRPVYRVVISEKSKDTFGDCLEQLGFYDPGANPKEIKLEKERIQYWISKGAQASPTVHNLLISEGVIDGKKVRASKTVKPVENKEEAQEKKSEEVEASSKEEKKEEVVETENKEEVEVKDEPVTEEVKEEKKEESQE